VVRTVQPDGHTSTRPYGKPSGADADGGAGGVDRGRRCDPAPVRRLLQFPLAGPVQVKGVSEPVEIYEVVGIGPLRTHFQLAVRRGLTRFVGRAAELAQLGRALELARAGRGQVIAAIRGVPFIENLARLDQSMILVIDITKCRDLLVALCNAPNVV
jgi:hypothetical protein